MKGRRNTRRTFTQLIIIQRTLCKEVCVDKNTCILFPSFCVNPHHYPLSICKLIDNLNFK